MFVFKNISILTFIERKKAELIQRLILSSQTQGTNSNQPIVVYTKRKGFLMSQNTDINQIIPIDNSNMYQPNPIRYSWKKKIQKLNF